MRRRFTVFLLLAAVAALAATQKVPPNPCPSVFGYYTQSNGDVYGQIHIPYDGSTTLYLGVNASVKGYYTERDRANLKIKLNTPGEDLIQQKVQQLSYDVYFPFQHTIPRITKIDFNNRQYCSGPPELLVAGEAGVTSLWAGHKYFFQISNLFGSNQLPISGSSGYPEIIVIEEPPDRPKYKPKPSVTIIDNPFLQNNIDVVKENKNNNQNADCGVINTVSVPLVLGGQELRDGMFPWLAALLVANGVEYEYKCTANLISNKHVITAARCIYYYKVQVVKTEDILFVFGKSSIQRWATNGAVTRGAAKVIAHPDFDPNSAHCDISIITLKMPVAFTSSVSPICLWDESNAIEDVVNQKGTVAGWGVDEGARKAGKLSTPIARYTDMPVVAEQKCLYSNLTYYSLTSDNTFCAGSRNGNGPCVGDSGAGFMMLRNGRYHLRGLASLVLSGADGQCDLANFVVFCDVAKLLTWVKEAMA